MAVSTGCSYVRDWAGTGLRLPHDIQDGLKPASFGGALAGRALSPTGWRKLARLADWT